jgi:hypothetical protein
VTIAILAMVYPPFTDLYRVRCRPRTGPDQGRKDRI